MIFSVGYAPTNAGFTGMPEEPVMTTADRERNGYVQSPVGNPFSSIIFRALVVGQGPG